MQWTCEQHIRQSQGNMRRRPLPFFYAFDLLHLEGEDRLRRQPDERRTHLAALIDGSGLLLSHER